MKLNFSGNFFSVVRFGDPGFVDYLSCGHSVGLEINKFVYTSEASLQYQMMSMVIRVTHGFEQF